MTLKACWPFAAPSYNSVASTGSPGSSLHIWPSPSAVDGYNEVFVRLRFGVLCPSNPPTTPISLSILFPLSHRCSQCHPTKMPPDKTVFCVSRWRKSRTKSARTPWEPCGWCDSAGVQAFWDVCSVCS